MEYGNHYRRMSNGNPGFLAWLLQQVKLSRIILLLLFILVSVPLVTHYYLLKMEAYSSSSLSDTTQDKAEPPGVGGAPPSDLKMQVEELKRIRDSVTRELLQLESQRQTIQTDLSEYGDQVEKHKQEVEIARNELLTIRAQIVQEKQEQKEIIEQKQHQIIPPLRILPSLGDNMEVAPPLHSDRCQQHNCFDYSRCSLTSKFPVYFYSPAESETSAGKAELFLRSAFSKTVRNNVYLTEDASVACVYVVLVGENSDLKLDRLPYWRGDGRNHILLNLAHTANFRASLSGVDTGRAMLVQSNFLSGQFRAGFDIVVPVLTGPETELDYNDIPYQVPAKRQNLLSFLGRQISSAIADDNKQLSDDLEAAAAAAAADNKDAPSKTRRKALQDKASVPTPLGGEGAMIKNLKKLAASADDGDQFVMDFDCAAAAAAPPLATPAFHPSDWLLCDQSERTSTLKASTFSLILGPADGVLSSAVLCTRLQESLKYGAIPVVLGERLRFPFDDFIDWRQAAVVLPRARVTELYFYLRTISHADILSMRRQGYLLWETYFSRTAAVLDTVLATVRTRISIPASPVPDKASPSAFPPGYKPVQMEMKQTFEMEDGAGGPVEHPVASPTFQRNFTYGVVDRHAVWNNVPGPFHSFPTWPFAPLLPSEAKFHGSSVGFRPIGRGVGGAGKEFTEALGGNVPKEQFTVVLLTYQREVVLMNTLQRFNGLPHLNKVVVVWNSQVPPTMDLIWPQIHAPIKVIQGKVNSLNNRFLPFDEIETEAVLSIDDDAHLRHDEILFGFRVWREARDRIVGFPGRYHAWDVNTNNGWLYNANYSCELSMVLTGAAFFHKYYMYLYSYVMPQNIRDTVDQFMNCEDIAMNFLVSHITRKPPVKVTSRWTFRCPGCPQALSSDDSHFFERHKCINFFTKIYGYMPLLNTQFRADSVLFKTRLPHDKQKCFKFI